MSLLTHDPLTQVSFSVYENKGVFAVLLGSGLSRAAEIPTGWEITLDLISRVAAAQGVEPQLDWAAWYRAKAGAEPDYSKLLEELASTPDERRSILHSYIEPSDEDREQGRKTPTAAHRAIAELVRAGYIRVIITTNFDRLMESALRELGVEPTIVASVDALQGAEPITHSMCYIVKLHGDYKDARILNTDQELSQYPLEYDRLLDRLLDEFGLIVCGWSGEWDHALRSAILRMPNRRYPVFWTARGPLASAAEELVKHRRARTIQIVDADSFFSSILQRIQTLEQTRRPNPLSVELLINSTKRYLAKPEHRIQLDQLFAEQANRLVVQLDRGEFDPNKNYSEQTFRERVARYESLSEPLARMAGVLGRWGDGSELSIVLDVLRAICAQARTARGGSTIWLSIRTYPAVLIFTAYGLGLTRAGRWGGLHTFFSEELPGHDSGSQCTVEAFFLGSWQGMKPALWNELENLKRRQTALSDHLVAIFEEWGRSFLGIFHEFELMAGRFELLASLAYVDKFESAEIEAALVSPPARGYLRVPIGRLSWNSEIRDRLLQELQTETFATRLADAGFGRGSKERLSLNVKAFLRHAGSVL
ncbi:SIR2 family protein [Marinimicrococcus flavescens]|uniref:SIR2 family protein n=1 Tax=Marinimicrococcus flavescens TaxID=3031815 RepID=A0AAP3XRN1_9PROT|nr:SIR2 family protein [Marinimicrococcus flavescens]